MNLCVGQSVSFCLQAEREGQYCPSRQDEAVEGGLTQTSRVSNAVLNGCHAAHVSASFTCWEEARVVVGRHQKEGDERRMREEEGAVREAKGEEEGTYGTGRVRMKQHLETASYLPLSLIDSDKVCLSLIGV